MKKKKKEASLILKCRYNQADQKSQACYSKVSRRLPVRRRKIGIGAVVEADLRAGAR